MSESTELYAVADCMFYLLLYTSLQQVVVEADVSLPNPNGIGNPIRWTSDCGMSKGSGEIWARVQGRPYFWLIWNTC
jgi:hypothetical protein